MGKWRVREPLKNDWLFSCPAETPTAHIVAALNVTEQPVIELSARNWTEDWQMANDLLRAYGYQGNYFYKPGQHVNWDSMNDWMFIKGWKSGEWNRDSRLYHKQFIGEVFVVRDCRAEAAESLAFLADLVYFRLWPIQKKPHLYPYTKLALILADWTEPILETRVSGRRVAFVVNPLPQDVMLLE